MPSDRDLLQLLRTIRHRLDANVSLDALASRAGWSPFHLHRAFTRLVGETPKHYTLRLRLEGAAARLLASDDSVLDVALAAGFTSHEVFTRAFRRHFGRTPVAYRATALAGASPAVRARHRAITDATGPCVGLFHLSVDHVPVRRPSMPTLSIERRELTPQPVLIMRCRTPRAELQAAIGNSLGGVFGHCMKVGLPLDGKPFVRYLSTGPGLWTIECGKPLAVAASGEGAIEAATLPGGPVVVAMHGGLYDQLSETYVAMERWMDANGVRPGGAPWESYLTDPAEHPDPSEWRTEVYWPLAQ
ncbi:MAG TPA: AraC family transcriptional regulator [Vicinamibacterales bacterium]|jgi:AraC family transcriptional regulator